MQIVSTGKSRTCSDADFELFKSGADQWRHPNTDWYADLIKKWTTTCRHNLIVDGGSRKMLYYVTLGLKRDGSS